MARIEVIGVEGIGEIRPGDDVTMAIAAAVQLQDGDIVVVSSKVVSKAAGRFVAADGDPDATRRGLSLAQEVLVETPHVVVVRTPQGWVCANAGIDASNVPGGDVLLLPEDPDADAERIRGGLEILDEVQVGVVIADTFGRAWREGQTDIALGVAGMPALRDERGTTDREGRELSVTLVAIADQVAGAADLVRDKAAGVPVVVVRGLGHLVGPGRTGEGAALVRSPATDLFPHGRGWLARRWVTGEGTPVRTGPPQAFEWEQVEQVAGVPEGRASRDGHVLTVADGLAAGRAEAALLDLGYAVDLIGDGPWTLTVGWLDA